MPSETVNPGQLAAGSVLLPQLDMKSTATTMVGNSPHFFFRTFIKIKTSNQSYLPS